MSAHQPARRRFLQRLLILVGAGAVTAHAKTDASVETAPQVVPCPWPRSPEELLKWRQAGRHLVTNSQDPLQCRLATAAKDGVRLRIRYVGGTEPGATREITPGALYTVEGYAPVYLDAYCHTQNAARTFALERLTLLP